MHRNKQNKKESDWNRKLLKPKLRSKGTKNMLGNKRFLKRKLRPLPKRKRKSGKRR